MRYKFFIPLSAIALAIGWFMSSFSTSTQIVSIQDITEKRDSSEIIRDTRFVRVFDLTVKPEKRYKHLDFHFTYTSFIIELLEETELKDVRFTSAEGQITNLNDVAHSDHQENRTLSSFVIPNQAQNYMDLYTGTLEGKIRVFLFYAPPIQHIHRKKLNKSGDSCERPAMVVGSIWRDGLSPPIGSREPSLVKHNIIHHAASSNTNHDYINVVRNIYLLHTQSNGWDDIGYNFLVAQDGTIFEGRDPKGVDDIDNIKGAHFCGKNSGTMGVCVLGNYMDISPSDSSLKSLKHLLVWKCVKSGIDPKASHPHPTNQSSALSTISGHRNGCATACPGDSLYMKLSTLRVEVNQQWITCGGVAGANHPINSGSKPRITVLNGALTVYADDTQWDRIQLVSISGMPLRSHSKGELIEAPIPGTYVIRLYHKGQLTSVSKIAILP